MKPYLASLINALSLVLFGTWGYFGSDVASATALIPVFTGLILLLMSPFFFRGNRIIAHIAVILTFLILLALIKPLSAAMGRTDPAAILRVSAMMLTSTFALVVFIQSFIEARRRDR